MKSSSWKTAHESINWWLNAPTLSFECEVLCSSIWQVRKWKGGGTAPSCRSHSNTWLVGRRDENGYYEIPSFTLRALGSKRTDCSFLYRIIYVLANTWVHTWDSGFLMFPFSAVMSRKTLEAVITSHIWPWFTAVTTPCLVADRGSVEPQSKLVPFQTISHLGKNFIFYASSFLYKSNSASSHQVTENQQLRSLRICWLLKCTCHFWQFGLELLSWQPSSQAQPSPTLSFASRKPGQLLSYELLSECKLELSVSYKGCQGFLT